MWRIPYVMLVVNDELTIQVKITGGFACTWGICSVTVLRPSSCVPCIGYNGESP